MSDISPVIPPAPPVEPPPSISAEAHTAELNRVGAAEKGKGVTAGKREILTATGFQNTAELVAFVEQQKGGLANATEAQQQVATLSAQNAALQVQVGQLGLSSAVSQALLSQGIQPDRAGPATQLILARPEIAASPDGQANQESISASVAAFRSEMSEWFPPAQPQLDPTTGLPVEPSPNTANPGQVTWSTTAPTTTSSTGAASTTGTTWTAPVAGQPVQPVLVGQPAVVPPVTGVQGSGAPTRGGGAAGTQVDQADAYFDRLHGSEVRQRAEAAADKQARANRTF